MKDKFIRWFEQFCMHVVIAIVLLIIIAFVIGCIATMLEMPGLIKWLIKVNGFA